MFKAIFNDKLNGIVHVLDDSDDRWQQYPSSDFHYAYRKSTTGTFTSIYGDKLEKITSFDETDTGLFESDLNIEMKVLLDLYKGNEEVSKGHRIVIYDIETSTLGGFPNVMLGDKEITAIALYDYATDKYYSLILDKENKVQNKIEGNQTLRAFETEVGLLSNFLTLWRELNPTIISGWNIWNFDDPYIYNRIKVVLGKKATYKLSPLGIVYQNQFNKKLVIGGVSSLDYIELYKKWCPVMKSSYSLASVSNDEELEHRKLTYKGNLDDLYRDNIEQFINYNLVDCKIIVDIEKKYKFIELAISICHKGHVNYESFRMSSRWIDGAILDYLHTEMNVIAPNKPAEGRQNYEDMIKSDEEGFEGAYVKVPQVGIHNDISALDVQSLYPSIIRTLNISPETKIGNIKNWDWDEYNNGNLKEIQLNEMVYTMDEFKRMISNHTMSISGCGTCYTLSKIGVIPAILTQWFEERLKYKKLQHDYNISGDKIKEEYYNLIQNRTKVFLNTCYGILGLPIFRFYDLDNAKSTTISGQIIIKKSEAFINAKFQEKLGKKYKVTYEDGTNEVVYKNQLDLKERGIIINL
jgi:DNA polymerase elongation subunit (family B)